MALNLTPVHNIKSADVVLVNLTTEDITKLVHGETVYINDEPNDLVIMINLDKE